MKGLAVFSPTGEKPSIRNPDREPVAADFEDIPKFQDFVKQIGGVVKGFWVHLGPYRIGQFGTADTIKLGKKQGSARCGSK